MSKIAQFGEEILDAVRGCKKEVFAKEKNLYNKAIVLNNFFRDWGHQFIYDFETVEAMLKMCKFKTIKRCEIYKSDYNDLTNIESHGKIIGEAFNEMETMVIEAKK